MNITIDKEAIEKAVSDAIIASAIGDKIEKTIRDLLSKGYGNPLDKAIDAAIHEIALSMVHTHFANVIEAAVKAKLTSDTVDQLVAKFWEKMLR